MAPTESTATPAAELLYNPCSQTPSHSPPPTPMLRALLTRHRSAAMPLQCSMTDRSAVRGILHPLPLAASPCSRTPTKASPMLAAPLPKQTAGLICGHSEIILLARHARQLPQPQPHQPPSARLWPRKMLLSPSMTCSAALNFRNHC